MKASPQLRDAMRAAIAPHDTPLARGEYRRGNYPRAELTRDIDKRYRWDLYWYATQYAFDSVGAIRDAVRAEQLNNAHIDTVLRSIVAPLFAPSAVSS